jgi:hypothetical protein
MYSNIHYEQSVVRYLTTRHEAMSLQRGEHHQFSTK